MSSSNLSKRNHYRNMSDEDKEKRKKQMNDCYRKKSEGKVKRYKPYRYPESSNRTARSK